MKDSMVLPNWAGKLFGILFLIVTLVLGYSVYQLSRIPQKEQKAFEKGENEALIHFRSFGANPEADGIYREWIEWGK